MADRLALGYIQMTRNHTTASETDQQCAYPPVHGSQTQKINVVSLNPILGRICSEAIIGFKSRIVHMWGGGVVDLTHDPHNAKHHKDASCFLIPEMMDTSVAYNTYSFGSH